MNEQRFVKAKMAAWFGIVGNAALALMKGVVGFTAGSKALIADATHSASDAANSFIVLVGLKAAAMPPDKDRPYDRGRAGAIVAVTVSVLFIVVGVEMGIHSVKSIYFGVDQAPAWYALTAIVISMVAKEIMFQYNHRLGKKLSGQAIIANVRGHRSDVYSSFIALIGVGGAIIGTQWHMTWLYYFDSAAGVLVALLVIRMGYRLSTKSPHASLDHVLHREDAEELIQTVQRLYGVISVDELQIIEQSYNVVIDVKISVNPRITVLEGHDIAKSVKQQLMEHFGPVSDVLVHVSPYDPGYPYKNNVDSEQDGFSNLLH